MSVLSFHDVNSGIQLRSGLMVSQPLPTEQSLRPFLVFLKALLEYNSHTRKPTGAKSVTLGFFDLHRLCNTTVPLTPEHCQSSRKHPLSHQQAGSPLICTPSPEASTTASSCFSTHLLPWCHSIWCLASCHIFKIIHVGSLYWHFISHPLFYTSVCVNTLYPFTTCRTACLFPSLG